MEKFPKIRKPFRKFGKTVRENGNLSEESENQSLNPLLNQESSSPQTQQTIQTFHTSQIAEGGEIQWITNVVDKEASTEVLLASEINQNPSFGQEKPSLGKENNSGGRSIVVIEGNQNGASSTIFRSKTLHSAAD